MSEKRITFVAQFPPLIHGLSKAVETLYGSRLKKRFLFRAVDIAENKKILSNLWNIITARTDAYYFTISQTVGGLWRDIALMMLMVMRRKPMIIHLHGGYLRTLIDRDCGAVERWLARKMISKAACCIVLGDSLRYIFKGIVDDDKIAVVPNCVDDEYLLPRNLMEEKLERLKNASALNMLYLSNFIATKGYREVLETAKVLKDKEQADKFRFHFAGKFFDPAEKDYFEGYIKDNDLQGMVEYHGIVQGDNKRDLLRQCHVFMLPTRYPNEGQPISILEAMGNAMTIVTTDHAGIPDIAREDNGLICQNDDINAKQIALYLEHCFDDRVYMDDVCRHNYEKTVNLYTQQRYIDNMEKVFTSITE